MKKLITLSLCALFIAAGCNQAAVQQQPTQNNQPVTAAPDQTVNPTVHTVNIQNFAFSQPSITVKQGETVTWVNKDSAPHTITGGNGGPNSQNLATDATYSFTFNTVGTFNYHCSLHPAMKGAVTVTP
jgi:plastocyanin